MICKFPVTSNSWCCECVKRKQIIQTCHFLRCNINTIFQEFKTARFLMNHQMQTHKIMGSINAPICIHMALLACFMDHFHCLPNRRNQTTIMNLKFKNYIKKNVYIWGQRISHLLQIKYMALKISREPKNTHNKKKGRCMRVVIRLTRSHW